MDEENVEYIITGFYLATKKNEIISLAGKLIEYVITMHTKINRLFLLSCVETQCFFVLKVEVELLGKRI